MALFVQSRLNSQQYNGYIKVVLNLYYVSYKINILKAVFWHVTDDIGEGGGGVRVPADTTSIDSLPVLRHRLKNYLFSHSYPGTVQ